MKCLSLVVVVLAVVNFSISQTTVQLGGTGTFNSFDLPVCNLEAYSYTQQIYTASELSSANLPEGANTITAIQFEYRGAAAGGENFNNWTVYVGNKSSATFSGSNDWTPVSEMTEVFNGIVPIPNASGEWFEVQFATPFEWDGTSNIVIAVDENASGHNSPAGFRTYGGSNSSLRAYKWSSMDPAADPSTYSGKTRLNNKPIIRFTFADGNDNGGDNGDNGDDNGTPTDTTQIEALTVDGFANFRGLTQFDGLVRMGGLTEVENSTDNQILFINGEGAIQRGGSGPLIDALYQPLPNELACFEGWRPSWSSDEDGNLYTKDLGNCEVNVGIGTDVPESRLHVIGDIRGTTLTLGRPSEIGGSLSVIRQVGNPNPNPNLTLLNLGYYSSSQEQEYNALTFSADGKLIIRNGLEKILQLESDGLLRAREVKVDLDEWPDYVFDENYELMPLSEVKRFIQLNGHLPNVPAASEVEENGVSLGETAKVTMEKVEELMLYVIQQQELLEEQREQLEEQAKKIEQLELKLDQPQR